jgi:cold shock CspA family protein
MREPLQITYRRLAPSNRIESCVRERLDALEGVYDGILSCDVLIEACGSPDRERAAIHIHLDLGLPGETLWVDRNLSEGETASRIVLELHNAFASMEHKLKDYLMRNPAGTRELPLFGTVTELESDMHYGIITASDGTEVYFDSNCVLGNAFDRIHPGSRVVFDAHPALLGVQALEVRLIDN